MSHPLGTTCSNLSGAVYTSSYDSWGNVTSCTYSSTTSTLTYDLLDHFVSWNAGSNNKDLYVSDASDTRVLRRCYSFQHHLERHLHRRLVRA